MRNWVCIFLLVMMPLQFTWAAMGTYCQHENGASTQHLGHHSHQHQAPSADQPPGGQLQSANLDADCGTCHSGCSVAVAAEAQAPVVSAHRGGRARAHHTPTAPPSKVPDRPQWLAAT